MDLETVVDVRTFITPQGYEDEAKIKGFTAADNLIYKDYIKLLRSLNRAVLKKSEVQEVRTVMSYYKGE